MARNTSQTSITVRLSDVQRKQIEAWADWKGCSLSMAVRHAIEELVDPMNDPELVQLALRKDDDEAAEMNNWNAIFEEFYVGPFSDEIPPF